DVLVDFLVAGGEHLADVLTQQIPIALLGLDAPSGPEVEPTIDDVRAGRTESDAGVLSPPRMFEPPTPKVDPLRSVLRFDLNAAIEIEIAEVTEAQKRRHLIDVALAAGDVLDLLEAQHHGLAAVEHDTVVDVELGEPLLVLLFALGGSRLL